MTSSKTLKSPTITGKSSLRVTNMVMTGRFPFRNKMNESEVRKLCALGWELINEETSPILQVRFEKEGLTVHHTKKCACVSVWASGAVNIVGITSEAEGHKCFDQVHKILKRNVRRVFE